MKDIQWINDLTEALSWGAGNATLLLGQISMVTVLALVSLWLLRSRLSLWHGSRISGYRQVLLTLPFVAVVIIDDRTGQVLDLQSLRLEERGDSLEGKGLIGCRDIIATVAGLAGGVWVGLGTGLVAGLHRLFIHGLDPDAANLILFGFDLHIAGLNPSPKAGPVAHAAALGPMILGPCAGLLRKYHPQWAREPIRAMLVGFGAIIIQRLIILGAPLFGDVVSFDLSLKLALSVLPVKLLSGGAGCWLFVIVMRMGRELSGQRMKILVLQAQMNAHFLGGSLSHIGQMINENPVRAGLLMDRMGRFYKDTQAFMDAELIPLRTEYEHVRDYLVLWESRFENNIRVLYDIDESLLDFKIPPFALQFLVENACTHGAAPSGVSVIGIFIRKQNGILEVTVSDNGRGFPEKRLPFLGYSPVPPSRNDGSGIGLLYLQQQVQLTLGPAARLECVNREDGPGARATLKLPLGA